MRTFTDDKFGLMMAQGPIPLIPLKSVGLVANYIGGVPSLGLLIFESRMAFQIRCWIEDLKKKPALSAGMSVVMVHEYQLYARNTDGSHWLKSLEGVKLARQDHQDLCEIQIVAFPDTGFLDRDPATKDLLREAMAHGADVVGGVPDREADHEAAARHIDFCLSLAEEFDADVDMHVDETDDPYWHTLELLTEAAARCGWGGRVSASHCCAMAAWGDRYASEIIERVAEVGINVITNPATRE